MGTLIQQRNINPKAGEWALTGGYINLGEAWQGAACREVQEEIGLHILEENLDLLDVKPSATRDNILIFCQHTLAVDMKDIHFATNEEVSAIKIIYEPMELCFPSHTEAIKEYFAELSVGAWWATLPAGNF
jgi:ADP-ribose pyrophosphatase YjhB (NUDIX family)